VAGLLSLSHPPHQRRNTEQINMSNRGSYLGAAEANALVGAWPRGGIPLMGHATGYGTPLMGYERGGFGRGGEVRREERRDLGRGRAGYGQPPGFGQPPGLRREERHEAHVIRKEEWEAAHPGQDWFERERRRAEWERHNPGTPFVGAEALIGALETAHGPSPRAWLREMAPPNQAQRQVLPMNTGTQVVNAGSSAQITSRPQRVAFRPERIFVSEQGTGAASWVINDVTIGNRSQFAQSGALPGDMFSPTAIDSFVTFETAQTAMDIVMIVTYNADSGSQSFYGGIIGTSAV
jgi:hypothetical protein